MEVFYSSLPNSFNGWLECQLCGKSHIFDVAMEFVVVLSALLDFAVTLQNQPVPANSLKVGDAAANAASGEAGMAASL